MTVRDDVSELVERFDRNREAYRASTYNETQVRREFIDPLFKALGWDVDNSAGYAELYKDVVHEDAIKVGGSTKAPDYCFRIGGTRKFFLEAKKPAINLKENPEPAYQLRRYAWTAKMPLSILTDFEEFIVYDTRVKPSPSDKSSTARTLYVPYTDYVERWDEIASIFSRDAVLKGAFDKYAESAKKKRGTAEVDDAFLAEIEEWRTLLARNIALRNNDLGERDLNNAVQRTIDRIVFLRICEDRGIENYGRLQALISGDQVYPRLCHLFREADDRYNSGLFHFRKEKDREDADTWTLALQIDDKCLKQILRRLYYPESPYEFSVLPADILGNVYERFLGSVISLTAGHQARVEQKPEVRKAGGVYYTPTYIVDYIVKQTVGNLLEGKTPQEAAGQTPTGRPAKGKRPVAILDPACGSGSFLLGAYQYLLDWYLGKYEPNAEELSKRKNPVVYQHQKLGWRLTTAERKRILLDHIHGVDLDAQAVEVTKLSLLLKVLEEESQENLQQLQLIHERALPDLDENIKCGNSLIGPEFYHDHQLDAYDEDEAYRINAFDWGSEFGRIMADGGFDAVIGNPPYIRVRSFKEIAPVQAAYMERRYRCATHVWDIYLLFFERGLELCRVGAYLSFIVPIQTLHQPNCQSVRELLAAQCNLSAIADLSRLRVFQKATVKNTVLVCQKGVSNGSKIEIYEPDTEDDLGGGPQRLWPQGDVRSNPGCSMKTALLSPKRTLCEKLRRASHELEELCYVTFGLRSCAKGRGQGGKDRLITSDPSSHNAKPYLEGRDIGRYTSTSTGRYIRYLPDEMYSPRTPELFERKKIVSQSMLSRMRLIAQLDTENHYVEQSLVCIVPHGVLTPSVQLDTYPLEFILGLMNSALQSFYFSTYIIDHSLGGGLIHATPGSQGKLLVPKATSEQVGDIVSRVELLLKLNGRLSSARAEHERTVLRRQIESADHEIDRLVYEVYGLSKEEISLVEDGDSGATWEDVE